MLTKYFIFNIKFGLFKALKENIPEEILKKMFIEKIINKRIKKFKEKNISFRTPKMEEKYSNYLKSMSKEKILKILKNKIKKNKVNNFSLIKNDFPYDNLLKGLPVKHFVLWYKKEEKECVFNYLEKRFENFVILDTEKNKKSVPEIKHKHIIFW